MAAPTVQATDIEVASITASSASITCTPGDGAKRIIGVAASSTGDLVGELAPTQTYSASTVFGSGDPLGGPPFYCVANGVGFSVAVTGLQPSTVYRIVVAEYNGAAGAEEYLDTTADNNPVNFTTGAASSPMFMGHRRNREQRRRRVR